MRLPLFTSLILGCALTAMDAPITINPISHPQAFFTELDNRVIKAVHNAQVACEQHDRAAMINHWEQISTLLAPAQEHKDDFLKAYEEKRPDQKRTYQVLSREKESLECLMTFRMQTETIISLFKETADCTISADEWHLLRMLFKSINPDTGLKKLRPDPGN